jgi:hypothetical protein
MFKNSTIEDSIDTTKTNNDHLNSTTQTHSKNILASNIFSPQSLIKAKQLKGNPFKVFRNTEHLLYKNEKKKRV